MRWSISATNTDAELSMVPWMSAIVSVTLGDVPATCHNARSASASSGRHSRIKKRFALSDKSIYMLWCGWHADRMNQRRVCVLPRSESRRREYAAKNRTYRVREGQPIRPANSSCFADFFRLLRSRVPLPVDGARRAPVGSPHFQGPTRVRRCRPERLSKFGASYRGHCRQ